MQIAIEALQEKLHQHLDRYQEIIGKIEALPEVERETKIVAIGSEWYNEEKTLMTERIRQLTRAISYLRVLEK